MSNFESQLSTLSAALDNNDRSIAGDFIGDEESRQQSSSEPSHPYEPDWAAVYEAQPAHDDVPTSTWRQDQGEMSGAAPNLNDTTNDAIGNTGIVDPDLEGAAPPRKKPRRRGGVTAKGKTSGIIEEGMITEYEDPSRDFRAGVVYIYAGPSAAQACMRCHAIKRKCDNGRPRCAGCAKADEPCAYEMNPATTSFVAGLKEECRQSRQKLREAEERVAQLEAALLASGQACPPKPDPATNTATDTDMAGFARHVLAMGEPSQPKAGAASIVSEGNETSESFRPLVKRCARVFFDTYSATQPFIAEGDFWPIYEQAKMTPLEMGGGDDNECLCFMICAAGAYVGETRGEVPAGTADSLRQRALQAIPPLVENRFDPTGLWIRLALLPTLYNRPVPGYSVSDTVDSCMKHALSVQLHRHHQGATDTQVRLRSRIWWTLYSHERVLAVTLGRPLMIEDIDIDLPLPGSLSHAEDVQPATDMQFADAIIRHRRLLGRIHQSHRQADGHLTNGTPPRSNQIDALESELELWHDVWSSPLEWTKLSRLLYLQGLVYLHLKVLSPRAEHAERSRTAGIEALELLVSPSPVSNTYVVIRNDVTLGGLPSLAEEYWICLAVVMHLLTNDQDDAREDATYRSELLKRITQCRTLLTKSGQRPSEVEPYAEIFERIVSISLKRVSEEPETAGLVAALPPPLVQIDTTRVQTAEAVSADFRSLMDGAYSESGRPAVNGR